MGIKLLYEAIAKVKWDGRRFSCIGKSFDSLSSSEQLKVKAQADFIIKVLKTVRDMKGGEMHGNKGDKRHQIKSR